MQINSQGVSRTMANRSLFNLFIYLDVVFNFIFITVNAEFIRPNLTTEVDLTPLPSGPLIQGIYIATFHKF